MGKLPLLLEGRLSCIMTSFSRLPGTIKYKSAVSSAKVRAKSARRKIPEYIEMLFSTSNAAPDCAKGFQTVFVVDKPGVIDACAILFVTLNCFREIIRHNRYFNAKVSVAHFDS